MNPKNELNELDQRILDEIALHGETEELMKLRQKIAYALEDLPEPVGKHNARMAIKEVRNALDTMDTFIRPPDDTLESAVWDCERDTWPEFE